MIGRSTFEQPVTRTAAARHADRDRGWADGKAGRPREAGASPDYNASYRRGREEWQADAAYERAHGREA